MSDIRTVWVFDNGDWVSQTGDLESCDDLDTAVLISLFTDRLARSDDAIDGDDRRGWWGDLEQDYQIGSRLWLLYRQKLTRAIADSAESYASEALQWLIDDNIASSVTPSARIVYPDRLYLAVVIQQPDGTTSSKEFDWAWGDIKNAV